MATIKLSDFGPVWDAAPDFMFYATEERVCSTRYLVRQQDKVLLIDSGDGKDGLDFVPDVVFLTHGHYDHAGGVKPDWPDVRIHEAENPSLPFMDIPARARRVGAGILSFGECDFEVIHTPGHTPGSACLFERRAGILFSGDTKFADGGWGRTDLGGSDAQMKMSLARLERLPYKLLCPGHGRLELRG